jgi:hypothetical protein
VSNGEIMMNANVRLNGLEFVASHMCLFIPSLNFSVREIEDDLEAAIFVCKESRSDMAIAKQQFTTKSLGILANYRKRQAALNLLSSLRTIDTLVRKGIWSH